MILIIAKNHVKPQCIEAFKELAAGLIEDSRKEEGCIEYSLYQDLKDPTILTFVEKWKSQEAIDFHNNTPHFTSVVPKFDPLCQGSSEVSLNALA